MQHAVNRMLAHLAHGAKSGHVLLHRHDLRLGQFFDQRVALHVVAMRVAAQENLDVGKFESQFLDRGANDRHRRLETAVDQNVTFWRGDQIRRELLGADVDVADYLVRRNGLLNSACRFWARISIDTNATRTVTKKTYLMTFTLHLTYTSTLHFVLGSQNLDLTFDLCL